MFLTVDSSLRCPRAMWILLPTLASTFLPAQDKQNVVPEKDPAVAQAVAVGLRWLTTHQDEDGKWSSSQFMRHDSTRPPCDGPGKPESDLGVTALARIIRDGRKTRPRQPYETLTKAVPQRL